MATKEQISKFINKIAPIAQADMKKTGILASITIAQACLESAYGTSDLATKANALFGIKKNGWAGKTYTKKSYEVYNGKKVLKQSIFRAYDSWEQSIADHSDYLRTRKVDGKNLTYKAVIGEKDYKKAAKALQKAGYSTYPNYAEMLCSLITTYNFQKYDTEKKAAEKVRIFLDAGHGGKDSGAVFGKRQEKNDTLKLTMSVGKLLKEYGFAVGYARKQDLYETPTKKAQDANDFNADYFFSFHRNCADGSASGYETLYCSSSTVKDAIRKDLKDSMKAIGFKSRPDKKRTDLTVLKKTKAPALLLEVGFIDSKKDNQIFDNNFQKIAKEIARIIWKHCR